MAKKKNNMVMISIVLLVIILLIVIFVGRGTSEDYTTFAKCLTEKGVKMYGTDWCPHCKDQKKMFGDAFKYVDYHNCDTDPECEEVGVQGFPTWIIDDKLYPGAVKLEVLSEMTECPLQ